MKKMFILMPLFIYLFSCEKSDKDELPLKFKLEVLNSQEAPANTFSEGEDPIFAFQISNTSDKDFIWYNYCEVFNEPDLYKTYQIVTSDTGEKNSIFVGKPYESPINCEDKPLVIHPGESYYLKLPWSFNSTNEELTSGSYTTDFTTSFTVNNQFKISQTFYKEFKIQ